MSCFVYIVNKLLFSLNRSQKFQINHQIWPTISVVPCIQFKGHPAGDGDAYEHPAIATGGDVM